MKLLDMAQANTLAIFNLARQMATAEAPSDVVNVWSEHAGKQFEMMTEQMRELTTICQKIAADSTTTIARGAERVSKERE